jgi:deazaflavin-dependent oxidoreductase (nitroreductase family)
MKAMFRAGTKLQVSVYRSSKGRLMNKGTGGSPVALLTVAGRKTGTPHTNPVAHFPHDGGWLVVGSAGGSPTEPQWFRNLRVADQATLEMPESQEVSIRVLEGAERDAAFTEVVAVAPGFGGYEKKSQGRAMPVALLTPR